MNQRNRITKWSTQNMTNQGLIAVLKDGLCHPVQTKYTDLSPLNQERWKFPVSIGTKKPAWFESGKATSEPLSYQNDPYNERKVVKNISRFRRQDRELGPEIRFGLRTENSRIVKQIQNHSGIDIEVVDTSMIHRPNWRSPHPKNKPHFVRETRSFSLGTHPAWE